MNLVSQDPGKTQSYWCTWCTQNFGRDEKMPVDIHDHEGARSGFLARSWLSEKVLFGERGGKGWVNFFPTIRGDLYMVLDDGWDVSMDQELQKKEFGCMMVSPERFPSFRGAPQERLLKLNEKVKESGWRGIGLWVACQEAERYQCPEGMERYWRERAAWCKYAGVKYWKVDWGTHCGDPAYRERMTEAARKVFPELQIEHAYPIPPINGYPALNSGHPGQRFLDWVPVCGKTLKTLKISQILRSYDVTSQLSVPTTLDRLSVLLANPGGLVNCEDEVYIGAALGCSLGIMRAPGWNVRTDYMPYRQTKKSNEAERAVLWQRMSPAFSGGTLRASPNTLTDTWTFRKGDTWMAEVIGKEVSQTAPAIMSRNMPLPEVQVKGEAPYVVCGRNPNGAVAVVSLCRVDELNRKLYLPKAGVTLLLEELPSVIGVFGSYEYLSIRCPGLTGTPRVYAQDILSERAEEITQAVAVNKDVLTIPGKLLNEIGQSKADPGDLSAPGTAIRIDEV